MFCISCLQLYLNSCFSVLFLRSKSCFVFCFVLYHILYFLLASIYIYGCASQFCFPVILPFVFCTPESYTIFCISCLQISKTCVSQFCVSQQYLLLFLHPWFYTMCHISCLQSFFESCLFHLYTSFINKQYCLHYKDWISKSLVDDRKLEVHNDEHVTKSHDMKVSWGV